MGINKGINHNQNITTTVHDMKNYDPSKYELKLLPPPPRLERNISWMCIRDVVNKKLYMCFDDENERQTFLKAITQFTHRPFDDIARKTWTFNIVDNQLLFNQLTRIKALIRRIGPTINYRLNGPPSMENLHLTMFNVIFVSFMIKLHALLSATDTIFINDSMDFEPKLISYSKDMDEFFNNIIQMESFVSNCVIEAVKSISQDNIVKCLGILHQIPISQLVCNIVKKNYKQFIKYFSNMNYLLPSNAYASLIAEFTNAYEPISYRQFKIFMMILTDTVSSPLNDFKLIEVLNQCPNTPQSDEKLRMLIRVYHGHCKIVDVDIESFVRCNIRKRKRPDDITHQIHDSQPPRKIFNNSMDST
jgi:hypothetical protein